MGRVYVLDKTPTRPMVRRPGESMEGPVTSFGLGLFHAAFSPDDTRACQASYVLGLQLILRRYLEYAPRRCCRLHYVTTRVALRPVDIAQFRVVRVTLAPSYSTNVRRYSIVF